MASPQTRQHPKKHFAGRRRKRAELKFLVEKSHKQWPWILNVHLQLALFSGLFGLATKAIERQSKVSFVLSAQRTSLDKVERVWKDFFLAKLEGRKPNPAHQLQPPREEIYLPTLINKTVTGGVESRAIDIRVEKTNGRKNSTGRKVALAGNAGTGRKKCNQLQKSTRRFSVSRMQFYSVLLWQVFCN